MRKLTDGQKNTLNRIKSTGGGRWVAGMGSRMAEQFFDGDEQDLNRRQVRALIDRGLVRIEADGRQGKLVILNQPAA